MNKHKILIIAIILSMLLTIPSVNADIYYLTGNENMLINYADNHVILEDNAGVPAHYTGTFYFDDNTSNLYLFGTGWQGNTGGNFTAIVGDMDNGTFTPWWRFDQHGHNAYEGFNFTWTSDNLTYIDAVYHSEEIPSPYDDGEALNCSIHFNLTSETRRLIITPVFTTTTGLTHNMTIAFEYCNLSGEHWLNYHNAYFNGTGLLYDLNETLNTSFSLPSPGRMVLQAEDDRYLNLSWFDDGYEAGGILVSRDGQDLTPVLVYKTLGAISAMASRETSFNWSLYHESYPMPISDSILVGGTDGRIFCYTGSLVKTHESADLGDIRYGVTYGDYIVLGFTAGSNAIRKYSRFDFLYTGQYIDAIPTAMCADSTYLYYTVGNTIYRAYLSNLTTASSMTTGYTFNYLCVDGSYLFAAAHAAFYGVVKYNKTTLAKLIDDGVGSGSSVRSILENGAYIYLGDTSNRFYKKAKTTLTGSQISASIDPFCFTKDTTFYFIGTENGRIQQRWFNNDTQKSYVTLGSIPYSLAIRNGTIYAGCANGAVKSYLTVSGLVIKNTAAIAYPSAVYTILAYASILQVVTEAATNISISQATLNGYLSGTGTTDSADVYFEYGTTSSYDANTTGMSKTAGDWFSSNITVLPGELYHYRAMAYNQPVGLSGGGPVHPVGLSGGGPVHPVGLSGGGPVHPVGTTVDGTFGDTVVHTSDGYINGYIRYYYVYCPFEGDVTSIMAYISSSSSCSIKCSIYSAVSNVDVGTLLATCGQRTLNTGGVYGWYEFPFNMSFTTSAGSHYFLAIWSNGGSAKIGFAQSAGVYYGGYTTRAYGSWPSPFTGEANQDRNYSFYVRYSYEPPYTGPNYYVDGASGSDSNNGSEMAPFQTIQKAINVSTNGNTIYIMAGTYLPPAGQNGQNIISGKASSNDWLTIRPYGNDKVIIDGSQSPYVPGGGAYHDGVIEITNSKYVRITGLIVNHSRQGGITINSGTLHSHIRIDHCSITNCSTFAIKGFSPDNLTIDHNYFGNNFIGWSGTPLGQEVVSIEGPVDFNIENNSFWGNHHINIDIKGGCSRGLIAYNTINTTGNPDEGISAWDGSSAIYIDARGISKNVSIYRNRIWGNQTGIDLNTETTGHFEYIYIYNNIVNITNENGGAPSSSGRSPVTIANTGLSTDLFHDIYYYNNLFCSGYQNDWPVVLLGHSVNTHFTSANLQRVYFVNNIFAYTTAISYALNMKKINYDASGVFYINNNSYYRTSGTINIIWNTTTYSSTTHPEKFGYEPIFTNPKFISWGSNFHLEPVSPCIDAGNNTLYPTIDFDGVIRPQGDGLDIGPYEFDGGILSFAYGADVTFMTPVGAPSDLSTVWTTSTNIRLTCTPGVGADRLVIRRNTGSYPTLATGSVVYNNTFTPGAVIVNDAGRDPAVHYYYRAWSYASDEGVSTSTSSDFILAEANAVTSIEETTATINGYMATVDSTVTGHFIYRIVGQANQTTTDGPMQDSVYEDLTGLTIGELYEYCLVGSNSSGGNTTQSHWQKFLTKPLPPHDVHANWSAVPSLTIEWTSGTGMDRTVITYGTAGYVSGHATWVYNSTGTSYAPRIDPTIRGYFRAWGYSQGGGLSQFSDGYSDVIMIETDPAALIEETTFDFKGYLAKGNDAFTQFLYGFTNGTTSRTSNITRTTAGGFTVSMTSMSPGKIYYVRGRANDSKGNSSIGNIQSFMTKPNPPVNITVSQTDPTYIRVNWTISTTANYTYIIRKAGSAPASRTDGEFIQNATTSTYYKDYNTTPLLTYYYSAWSLTSYNSLSQWSDTSITDSITASDINPPLISLEIASNTTLIGIPQGWFNITTSDDSTGNIVLNTSVNNGAYWFNETVSNPSTTSNHYFNLDDSGTNTFHIKAMDINGNIRWHNTSYISYFVNVTFCNERNGSRYDWTWAHAHGGLIHANLTMPDLNYTMDLMDIKPTYFAITTTESYTIIISLTFNRTDSAVLRVFNTALLENGSKLGLPQNQTTFNQQLIYSTQNKAVIVNNVQSDTIIAADYTDKVYESYYASYVITIDMLYYLYTIEDGQRVLLASISGGQANAINLDFLTYDSPVINFSLIKDEFSILPYSNNTVAFYYLNLNNDSAIVSFTVECNGTVLFTYTETTDPNEILIYFNWATLDFLAPWLYINVTVTKNSGSTHTINRQIKLNSDGSGEYQMPATPGIPSAIAVIFAFGIAMFGLTMASREHVFGIFGIIIELIAIAITTLADQSQWYVHFTQAIILILLIFTFLTFKEEGVKLV